MVVRVQWYATTVPGEVYEKSRNQCSWRRVFGEERIGYANVLGVGNMEKCMEEIRYEYVCKLHTYWVQLSYLYMYIYIGNIHIYREILASVCVCSYDFSMVCLEKLQNVSLQATEKNS